jgi:predicted ArsR family transcriptional regulator
MWSIAPDAQPGGDPPTAYADLGRWLAQILASGKTGLRTVETTGREIGRDLAPAGGQGSAEQKMYGTLISLGFQPRPEIDPAGKLTYRLCNCPYRAAVRENQQLVCTLHRGMTRGLLDELSAGTKLSAFVPRDPDAAGCLVELQGGLVDEAIAEREPTAR